MQQLQAVFVFCTGYAFAKTRASGRLNILALFSAAHRCFCSNFTIRLLLQPSFPEIPFNPIQDMMAGYL